jgi:hypothetical protein
LCLKEGLLSEEQLIQLLDQQATQRRSLGMALVDLGILDADKVEAEMALQEAEEGPGPAEMPSFVLPDAVETDLARWAVRVVSTQYLRLTQEKAGFRCISPPEGSLQTGIIAAQNLEVHSRFQVMVCMSDHVAAEIGTRYLEEPTALPDPLCADAVCEFLNIVVGHLIGHVTPSGARAKAWPPEQISPERAASLEGVFFHGIIDAGGREIDVVLSRC